MPDVASHRTGLGGDTIKPGYHLPSLVLSLWAIRTADKTPYGVYLKLLMYM